MTTEELFNKIRGILKEKGKLPDILDYGLAAHNPAPIRTCEFDLKSNLTYGGNEGIYLSLSLGRAQTFIHLMMPESVLIGGIRVPIWRRL